MRLLMFGFKQRWMQTVSGSLVLIGSLAVCAPTLCGGQTLAVIDSSFESRNPAWSVPVQSSGYISYTTEPVRSGRRSLAIQANKATIRPWAYQTLRDVEAGATIKFSAWERGIPASSNTQATLRMEAWSSDNQRLGEFENAVSLVPARDWNLISLEAEIPVDTARVSIILQLTGAGTLYFDDVSYETIAPPKPFHVRLQSPVVDERERFTLEIPVHLFRLRGESNALQAEIRIVDRAKRSLETIQATAPTIADTTFTIQPQKLDAGVYSLELRIPALSADTTVARNLYVMPKRKPPKALSKEGWYEDASGNPFFPIGLYHVTTSDYPGVAAQGFNTVQGITTRDLEEFGKSLDLARQNGLMVDVPLYTGMQVAENLSVSTEKITRFADHPAVLDWKLMDEPEFRPALEAEIFDAYSRLAEQHPPQPLLLSAYNPARYGFWSRACDALITDPYPLPDHPLGIVGQYVRAARQAAESWQHIGVSLQAGWLADLSNQPTFEQARTMVFLAILQGAQSVFWYSLHDPGWNLMETPLWNDFPELNRLTATLAGIVRDGREERGVEIVGDGIVAINRCAARTVENKKEDVLYALLVNPSIRDVPVIITVPKRWQLDTRTPQLDVVKIDDTHFKVTLDPEISRAVIFVR